MIREVIRQAVIVEVTNLAESKTSGNSISSNCLTLVVKALSMQLLKVHYKVSALRLTLKGTCY